MIRSSKHHFHKHINKNKHKQLKQLLTEYRRVLQLIVNDLIKQNKTPKYYNIKQLKNQTWLSQRTLRSLSGHAISMTKSFKTKKQKKTTIDCSRANMSLNSINCDTQKGNHFDEFLRLKALGNKKFIKIPIKHHKIYNKWNTKGKRINGIEINDQWVKINFEIKEPKPKTKGKTVGADQGYKTIITLSDGQKTDQNLITVLEKLRRKQKGSKAFHKTQQERTNIINQAINKLNFDNIKELRLEDIKQLRHKKKTKYLKNKKNKITQERLLHWTYPLIKRKIESKCKENGVRFSLQSSFYRSQRCSSCGLVLKKNRRDKLYSCSCGVKMDSDLNAAKNHECDLPVIPSRFLGSGLNKLGFYWLESGLFDLEGGSLQSPLAENTRP